MRYLSVVIPAYNEANRIMVTLNEIVQFLGRMEEESELIIVNDGSTDSTEKVIRNFMHALDDMSRFKIQVIYLKHAVNQGKGAALKFGLMEAQGHFVLFMDADNSTRIQELNKLFPHIHTQYDIAIGSRNIPQSHIITRQTIFRQTMRKIFNVFVQMFAVKGIIDTQCGFKLFKRNVLTAVVPECRISGFAFDVELLFVAKQKKFKIIEIPITWNNHPDSHAKLFSSSLQMFIDLLSIHNMHKKKSR